jgi:SAM-dependent methyltransferase
MLPFRLGSPADFAAVRELFDTVGFTTKGVCQRGGVKEIYQFCTIAEGRETAAEASDALEVLIRLFIDGFPVPADHATALLPAAGIAALEELHLIARHPRSPDQFAASVRLYPTEGLYIASDLEKEGPGLADPAGLELGDHVFSAITTLTGTFLSQLPTTPCDRFLELCAGTGIAALAASRFSGEAWAVDITERSTRFAEFNALFNAIDNVSALQGDLYQPVTGMTFDRIVAHPPYVPATDIQLVYRDGGEDGEVVIRRMFNELPAYLSPGGCFYCTCVASDRKDAPLEMRIRDMLGERQPEFDVLVVTHQQMPPSEYYGRLAVSGRISFDTAEQRTKLFRELGAEQIVYSSMVVQRHAEGRAPFTLRRERTNPSAARETDWLLRWHTRLAEENVLPALMESRPRLLPHAELHVKHRVENGEWKVDSSKVTVEYPFIRTVELSMNAAMLLTLCDGEHSLREILNRLQESGAISPEVPVESFAEFIRELVTEGVLGVGGEPSPNEAIPKGSWAPRQTAAT